MYYIYVLKSLTHGNRYVGSTGNVEKRLFEHNAGRCRYTSGRRPWTLVYVEPYSIRYEAVRRERFFKSGQGRMLLDEILSNGSAPKIN